MAKGPVSCRMCGGAMGGPTYVPAVKDAHGVGPEHLEYECVSCGYVEVAETEEQTRARTQQGVHADFDARIRVAEGRFH